MRRTEMKLRYYLAAIASVSLIAILLAGCASPQDKAANAQRQASQADVKIKQERLKMIDEYKKCISDAGDDSMKADNCDRILKAIEALK
jgi:hypothetical protein